MLAQVQRAVAHRGEEIGAHAPAHVEPHPAGPDAREDVLNEVFRRGAIVQIAIGEAAERGVVLVKERLQRSRITIANPSREIGGGRVAPGKMSHNSSDRGVATTRHGYVRPCHATRVTVRTEANTILRRRYFR